MPHRKRNSVYKAVHVVALWICIFFAAISFVLGNIAMSIESIQTLLILLVLEEHIAVRESLVKK